MIQKIISFSIRNKFIVALFTFALIGAGVYSIKHVHLGTVPDITDNQVQVITVSPNLSTTDVEQFITYPIELSMGNLPDVVNIRSISRFGLSVVTVVFDDEINTYLARQLVGEQLNEVRDEIPEKFGQPYMGPISTGLGEVYQYYLEVDPAYDSVYSLTDLRTIQDWIVKRQMAMLPGVVEVNTSGGHLKQYEVLLNPNLLKNYGVTPLDVYEAIASNNDNTGSAYIEKDFKANFIRGEGLIHSIEDIKNVVIKTNASTPLLVKDVAKVDIGGAVRYGAFTYDGNEAVGGAVMMLKDANSHEVIQGIHERVEQIQKSLPEGIQIQPFLDRSDLIGHTTHTIVKNLSEGALIVVFVLVLLLGSLRGGLLVASVIPLSLFFAFIMMNLFGIEANLMSLGAIDFGILVDGAVIIVEGVVHSIDKSIFKGHSQKFTQQEIDGISEKASNKMMNSAFFGQLIILVVFIPILALKGIEGKMFIPMALTFGFAVMGAMILCLTYIPMVSALFLYSSKKTEANFIEKLSHKIMHFFERVYHHVIHWAIDRGRTVIGLALVLLLIAGFTFTRMGAVFVPSLDEGDFALQVVLKSGTSLTETIKVSNQIERLLKSEFPEVKNVLARMGVSEIPTDPMSMEQIDMFATLRPKSEWTSAKDRDELIDKMKEAVEVIPGINVQFSQPIELRFNELLTGVREDIAIKIYGEDVDVLAKKAQEVASIIKDVKGIGDLSVEATRGLPQITIQYKRDKLAQYGLNIENINHIISLANVGSVAGQIFEGEKRFDIVLRLDKNYRQSIDDFRNLFVTTPKGQQIPLREVADINFQDGPVQVSRDDTKRRVYVGVNVRGRDVESLVHEIQERLDKNLKLDPGYFVTYGGEFENLQQAMSRLSIVVPIALALIFILLYFSLQSITEALMIYIAIPLATIGGIFSLYFRGIPFSISAGVGFIVLFGVAVLNGLVLINSLNELKRQGVTDIKERVFRGTAQRLRPILLTAIAAMMGFIPMALSTSAGAEVQRPLATVVIGGLFSATLLTLVVLPVLYYLIENRIENRKMKNPTLNQGLSISLPLIFCLSFFGVNQKVSAQENTDTLAIHNLQEAEKLVLENNLQTRVAKLKVSQQSQLEKTAADIPQTSFYYGKEEFGHSKTGITSYGISQDFDFPTIYKRKSQVLKEKTHFAQSEQTFLQSQLLKELREHWYALQSEFQKQELLEDLENMYKLFYQATTLQYESGEINKLAQSAAKSQQFEIQLKRKKVEANIRIHEHQLAQLLNSEKALKFTKDETISPHQTPTVLSVDSLELHPLLELYKQQINISQAELGLAKSQMLPSLSTDFAYQNINRQNGFYAFQVGVGLPLWMKSQKNQIKAAKTQVELSEQAYLIQKQELETQYKQILEKYNNITEVLNYYQEVGLPLADEIIQKNTIAFKEGEINYIEYLQNINRSIEIKESAIDATQEYYDLVTEIKFLINE
ncbi:MAG: CusA/CzcA family heavy metal efflux RND transporter [Chitinophagales bacterium]|nr:CusA/CzcA family heavy metal efflux RND transporter [Chitinophagales bacterium]